MESFERRYTEIWDEFVDDIVDLYKKSHPNRLSEGMSVHEQLRSIYDLPKVKFREYMRRTSRADVPDVGSVTGFFFEDIVHFFVQSKLSSTANIIERNACSVTKLCEGLPVKKPDIFLSSGNRHVFIEVKFAPKLRDINYVEDIQSRIATGKNERSLRYYLIGGWLSVNSVKLHRMTDHKDWMCFMQASERNKNTGYMDEFIRFDDLLETIKSFLQS